MMAELGPEEEIVSKLRPIKFSPSERKSSSLLEAIISWTGEPWINWFSNQAKNRTY